MLLHCLQSAFRLSFSLLPTAGGYHQFNTSVKLLVKLQLLYAEVQRHFFFRIAQVQRILVGIIKFFHFYTTSSLAFSYQSLEQRYLKDILFLKSVVLVFPIKHHGNFLSALIIRDIMPCTLAPVIEMELCALLRVISYLYKTSSSIELPARQGLQLV